ncbi:MAG: hypothetical protein IJ837_03100 [Clostridia bacterium]|nr:hypothetical protein [Clostridia bacterium]
MEIFNALNHLKKGSLPHSIMLISEDKHNLSEASFYFAKMVLCESDVVDNTCLNCRKINHLSHADVMIYPAEKQSISVEEMVALTQDVYLSPYESNSKVYILNNFSETNALSQNKLLKTLEEPPKNVYFVLNTTNEAKVLPTILSRCQKIYLPKYSFEDVLKFLEEKDFSSTQKNDIASFCSGSINRAKEFSENQNFFEILDFCFDMWKNLRSSSKVLPYASKLYNLKTDFKLFLYLYNSVLEDILNTKLNIFDLVKNKNRIEEYKIIATDFSEKALLLIAKELTKINEKLERNCNQNIVVDNFLLYVLEVRAKWQ